MEIVPGFSLAFAVRDIQNRRIVKSRLHIITAQITFQNPNLALEITSPQRIKQHKQLQNKDDQTQVIDLQLPNNQGQQKHRQQGKQPGFQIMEIIQKAKL